MQSLKLKIIGKSPLLMHCDRYANPLDPATKAHKVLTSKKKKTEDDHESIAKSEWRGSLYHDKDLGPYLPTASLRAALVNGATLRKLGKTVKRGTLILEDKAALEYKGPRDPDEMVNDNRFIDCRSVCVQGKRLMRYRPVFDNWSVNIEILFDDQLIDRADLLLSMEEAGRLIGVGDFRPDKGGTFGRFAVEEV